MSYNLERMEYFVNLKIWWSSISNMPIYGRNSYSYIVRMLLLYNPLVDLSISRLLHIVADSQPINNYYPRIPCKGYGSNMHLWLQLIPMSQKANWREQRPSIRYVRTLLQ